MELTAKFVQSTEIEKSPIMSLKITIVKCFKITKKKCIEKSPSV